MDKAELVGLTLDRLIDHFNLSPESFEFFDRTGAPTILWRPKIQLGDLTSNPIYDPNNAHAVVARYNPYDNSVSCFVFLSAPADPINTTDKADTTMTSKRYFETYRGNYRKLMRLKELVLARNIQKDNLIYLRKLSSVFPDAVDNHIR